jgi:putative NADH-flavin reductase
LDNPVFDANNKSTISVEDLAVAILDEVENPKHIRVRFTVGY